MLERFSRKWKYTPECNNKDNWIEFIYLKTELNKDIETWEGTQIEI